MQLIALTGGMASGKSTIGKRLESLGAVRIDADQLARDAVAPGAPGLDRVRERFGAGIITESGELDRAELGKLVFADEAALNDLNDIIHPEVRRLAQLAIDHAVANDPDAVVVYEIPLFVESGAANRDQGFDWTLVVTAETPKEQRIERAVNLRGMTEEDARNRMANQASDAERRAAADIVIDTSGTLEQTIHQVDELWSSLRG